MNGKLKDWSFSRTGESVLTITTRESCKKLWDALGDQEITFSIKRRVIPRSLNANNYAWSLIEKLAVAVKSDKDSVYEEMLRRYGTGETYTDEAGNECKVLFSLREGVPPALVARHYTIEGNTSSAPGVVPNGGMVRNKSYSINYAQIGGYGTPDWSLVKEEEEMAEITQDKFNEMFKVAMNAYRAELQDNDCGNFSADGRKFVEETGLLVGGSKLPNGEANFMWQDFLTREQFATVLYRFAQKFGLS